MITARLWFNDGTSVSVSLPQEIGNEDAALKFAKVPVVLAIGDNLPGGEVKIYRVIENPVIGDDREEFPIANLNRSESLKPETIGTDEDHAQFVAGFHAETQSVNAAKLKD